MKNIYKKIKNKKVYILFLISLIFSIFSFIWPNRIKDIFEYSEIQLEEKTSEKADIKDNFIRLYDGISYTQYFISNVEYLSDIVINIDNTNRAINGYLIIALYDENNNKVTSRTTNLNIAPSNFSVYLNVKKKNIIESIYKKYYLKIETKGIEIKENLKIKLAEKVTDGDILKNNNDKELKNIISFTTSGSKKSYTNFFVFSLLSFILFGIILFKKLTNTKISIEKIDFIWKNNIIFSIVEFILSLALSFILYKLIINSHYYYYINYLYFLIGLLLCLIITIFIVLKILIDKLNIEKIFLLIVIPIGILYMIFLIPNEVPDENRHYMRALAIAQGNIIQHNDKVLTPKMIADFDENVGYNYMIFDININEKSNIKHVIERGGAVGYSSILYIFPSIGIKFCSLLGLNPYIGYYVARTINFVIFLCLGYLSLKLLPVGKKVLFVYLFNPILLQQAISISADSLINSVILLYISYILYLKFSEHPISKKSTYILGAFIIFIPLVKYAYAPMLLLIFLLKDKFKEKNLKDCLISFIIVSITITMIWFLHTKNIETVPMAYYLNNKVSAIGQIKYLLNDFTNIFYLITNTFNNYFEYYIYTFAGKSLGWLNIEIPSLYITIYIFILLIVPFLNDESFELSKNEKKISIIIYIICFCAILGGLYLLWSPVGSNVVTGVQGRYFVPINLLLLLCLIKKHRNLDIKCADKLILIYLIALNIYAIKTIILFLL